MTSRGRGSDIDAGAEFRSDERKLARRDFLSVAAVASGAVAGAPGCCPCSEIRPGERWQNSVRSDRGVEPRYEAYPASLKELVDLVKRARKQNAVVRMTGSGHSFSDVAFSCDYLLRPQCLDRVLQVEREQLRWQFRDDPFLVRVESGMRLRELNAYLDEEGLAMPVLGGYDIQTIAGAAMTSTHGSGFHYGPVAEGVQSIQIVTEGGEVLQVEPSHGITDAQRFPGYVATSEGAVPARLVQDDDTFYAVAVSMGTMGVVYSVTMRVVRRFWIREIRTLSTWGEVTERGGYLDNIVQGRKIMPGADPDPEFYELYFNPYPPKHGKSPRDHHVIETKRYKLTRKPRLKPGDDIRGQFGTELGSAILSLVEGEPAAWWFNNHQSRVAQLIDDALAAIRDDGGYVNKSFDVFNIGDLNLFRVYAVEPQFRVEQTIAATERCFEVAAWLKKEKKAIHTSPPALRFVGPSKALLSMQNGRRTATMELAVFVEAKRSRMMLEHYEKTFVEEFGARPHWGLDLNYLKSWEQVRALYPDTADRWLRVYERMNASGTFDSPFTERMGISRGKHAKGQLTACTK